MQAAKRAGEHVGPPRRLTADKFDLALQLIEEGKGKAIAARMAGVDPSTLRRLMNGTK